MRAMSASDLFDSAQQEAPGARVPGPEPSSPGTSAGTRRRGRPPRIDEDAVLEVARQVFLERGIRATTSEVAERAGVSEGSLFHRFGSKDELFRRSMKLDPAAVVGQVSRALRELGELPAREALSLLAARMLEAGRVVMPLMMMSWSNAAQCSGMESGGHIKVMRSLVSDLVWLFRERIARGELRDVPPEVLARVFMGSLHHFTLVRIVAQGLPGPDPAPVEEEEFIRGLLSLLLREEPPA